MISGGKIHCTEADSTRSESRISSLSVCLRWNKPPLTSDATVRQPTRPVGRTE
jgi:hypothetical protein